MPTALVQELDDMPMTKASERLDILKRLARHRHPNENRVGCMVAPSAPQRCTEQFLRDIRTLADEFALPVIMHVQETRMQVVTGQLWYTARPSSNISIAYSAENGKQSFCAT